MISNLLVILTVTYLYSFHGSVFDINVIIPDQRKIQLMLATVATV